MIVQLLVGSGSIAFAEEVILEVPRLKAEVQEKSNTVQYQIGDRIQFNVLLPYEISSRLRNFKLKSESTSNENSGIYIDPSPQVINGSIRFSVSPLKPGKLITPELNVVENENSVLAKIQSITIDVSELKSDPKEEPQLLDPVALSIPLKYIVLGLLTLAFLIYAGIWIYRKYLKKKPVPAPITEIRIPPVPDHEIALRDLNTLYDQFPFSGPNLKPIAFGVSQILKNYFSARFKIDARESTTIEMINLLRAETLPEPEIKRIVLLFRDLDQIKFTDFEHHSRFEKTDYQTFKDTAKLIIEAWTVRGGNR